MSRFWRKPACGLGRHCFPARRRCVVAAAVRVDLLTVYILLILAYVLTSWVRMPYSLHRVQRFLDDVCEPYIRIFRRVLPSVGPLDLSPIVAVITLILLRSLLVELIGRLL